MLHPEGIRVTSLWHLVHPGTGVALPGHPLVAGRGPGFEGPGPLQALDWVRG